MRALLLPDRFASALHFGFGVCLQAKSFSYRDFYFYLFISSFLSCCFVVCFCVATGAARSDVVAAADAAAVFFIKTK